MSATRSITIGTHDNGTSATYNPAVDGHLLIAGRTGSGKTTVLRNIVSTALAQGGSASAYVFDVVRGGSEIGLTHPGVRYAPSLDSAAALMAELLREVKQRNKYDKQQSMLVVIEDTNELLQAGAQGVRIQESLNTILREGPLVGVTVLLSTQRAVSLLGVHTLIPNFSSRLLLGSAVRAEGQTVLGVGGRALSVGRPGYGVFKPGSTGVSSTIQCSFTVA